MHFLNEIVFNFWYWWYYEQFIDVFVRGTNLLRRVAVFTGIFVHLRYLFVPLYQQYSIPTRIFSILFRLGIITLGSIALIALALVLLVALAAYLILPISPLLKLWLAILA